MSPALSKLSVQDVEKDKCRFSKSPSDSTLGSQKVGVLFLTLFGMNVQHLSSLATVIISLLRKHILLESHGNYSK